MLANTFVVLSLVLFAAAIPAKRQAMQVITECTVPNTAALTFDDGPYIYMQKVSDALIAAGGKGTFFFNGNNYGGCIYNEDQSARVKHVLGQGHQIASHTWSHAMLSTLNRDQLNSEFSRQEQAIQRITGVLTAFTRPPYGDYNDLVIEVANAHGQTLVNWDFDSGDTAGKSPEKSKQLYKELADRHPSTILALNHDVKQGTAEIVAPYAIDVLTKAGYMLVTVAECLGRSPYLSVGPAPPRDEAWLNDC